MPSSRNQHQRYSLLSYSPQLCQSLSLFPVYNLGHPLCPIPVYVLLWECSEFCAPREFNLLFFTQTLSSHPMMENRPWAAFTPKTASFILLSGEVFLRTPYQMLWIKRMNLYGLLANCPCLRLWVSVFETKSLLLWMTTTTFARHPFGFCNFSLLHPNQFISPTCFHGLVISVVTQHTAGLRADWRVPANFS